MLSKIFGVQKIAPIQPPRRTTTPLQNNVRRDALTRNFVVNKDDGKVVATLKGPTGRPTVSVNKKENFVMGEARI